MSERDAARSSRATRLRSRFSKRRRIALAVAVVGTVLMVGFALQRRAASLPGRAAPPSPDLEGVEQQVAERIRELRLAVEDDRASAEAWGQYAMVLHIHQLAEDAIDTYREAGALDGSDFRWHYFGAMALYAAGREEALEWYERARGLAPDYEPLLVRYGTALLELGHADSAAVMFRRALDRDPQSSHARLGLARIALAAGDLAAGEAQLLKAVDSNPRHGEARGLLAEVYRRQNRLEDAERELRRARAFEKTTPLTDTVFNANVVPLAVSSWWFLRRGRAMYRSGQYEAALQEFRSAFEARPDAETRFHLGLALQGLGQYADAVGFHREALVERPEYQEALHNLGVSLAELGRVREGMNAVRRARAIDPTQPDAYLRLGMMHERCGEWSSAIEQYREGLDQAEYDDRLQSRLAWLLSTVPVAGLRDAAEATRLAEEAVEVTAHQSLDALDALAAAYARAGRFADAIDVSLRATAIVAEARRPILAKQLAERMDAFERRIPLGDPGNPAIRIGETAPANPSAC